MIARASTTKGSSQAIEYQANKDKSVQSEVYNLSNTNPKNNWEEMKAITDLNTQTKKPICNHVISPSKEANEILTDKDYKDIAERYAKEMGFYQNQWRYDVHKNTDDTHIHIVANRINLEGKNTVKSARIGMKAGKTADKIAKEKGLRTAKEITKDLKIEMEKALNQSFDQSNDWADMQKQMKNLGFDLKLSTRTDGEVYGARVIPLNLSNPKNGSFKEKTAPKGFKLSQITRNLPIKMLNAKLAIVHEPIRKITKPDRGFDISY